MRRLLRTFAVLATSALFTAGLSQDVYGQQLDLDLRSNEPTIAVNPINPNNIVAANFDQGRQRLKISTDGGATFPIAVSAVLVTGQTFTQGDDSLAFDSQGRLFWSFLSGGTPSGPNVVVEQVDPINGTVIAGSARLVATSNLDKAWIAADANPASPFANNLYIVWTDFNQSNAPIRFARSTDHGATWTTLAGNLSAAGEGFTWPPEVAVGSNGDVWAAWHMNSTTATGGVRLRRSTDGGVTFGPELIPFPNGTAAVTGNGATGVANKITGMHMWLQGAVQPRILPDPARANAIYIVCANDPDGFSPTNDPSDIVIARSTDNGATWTRATISQGAAGDSEIMPSASIDASGRIAVSWYDNRRRLTVADALGGTHFLLDLYTTTSVDGGVTFSAPARLNDVSFDPEANAPDRFGNHTLRIGEYNGLAIGADRAHAVWTGNRTTTPVGQGVFYNSFAMPGLARSTAVTVSTAAGQYSDVVTLSAQVSPTGAAGSVSFTVNGGAAILATYNPTTGAATASYTIPLAAGGYTIGAAFTSSDTSLYTNSSGTSTLTVSREDAVVTPSLANPTSVRVASAGGTSPAFTLAAAITDVADGSLGDTTNAVPVTFTLTPVLSGSPVSCTATTSGGGVGAALNASCTFTSVPVNLYQVSIAVGGNYYTGTGTSVVSIYDPSLGFITGGGTLIHNGVPANFGFTVKYLKNGNIQGGLLYTEHQPTGDIVVKTNALGALSIVGNSAVFTAKATVDAVGNHSVQATVVDNGEPGVNDQFGLVVVQPNGIVRADLTSGIGTIYSGNIQVPQGAK